MVVYAYWLLAVPANLPSEEVIALAESGMLSVVVGGVVLIGGLLRRS